MKVSDPENVKVELEDVVTNCTYVYTGKCIKDCTDYFLSMFIGKRPYRIIYTKFLKNTKIEETIGSKNANDKRNNMNSFSKDDVLVKHNSNIDARCKIMDSIIKIITESFHPIKVNYSIESFVNSITFELDRDDETRIYIRLEKDLVNINSIVLNHNLQRKGLLTHAVTKIQSCDNIKHCVISNLCTEEIYNFGKKLKLNITSTFGIDSLVVK